jgi:protein-S-isoprenylcysteine O-methyltransferase Ste14
MYLDITGLFVLLTLGGLGELWVIYRLGKKLAGWFGDRMGFHLGNALTLLSFTPFLLYFFHCLSTWGTDEVAMPTWAKGIGIALVAVGGWVTWIGVRQLSSATWFSRPKFKEEGAEELVDHGIYGLIRHPTYLGQTLAIYGIAILIPMKITLLMAIFLHVYFFFIHARIEEWRCLKIFGADYRAYMARTNRFFPVSAIGRLMTPRGHRSA